MSFVDQTRPVALVHRTNSGRDSDGNVVYSETFTVTAGKFAPGGTSEAVQGQDQVVSLPTLYFRGGLPEGVDVSAVDAVVIDPVVAGDEITAGDRYEISGDPADWGVGLVLQLKRVSG